MKLSKIKTLGFIVIILIPLFLPLKPLTRFGIPLFTIIYLLISRRGTFWYLAGLRAGKYRDHEKILRNMLRASRSKLSIQRGCITAISLLKYGKEKEATQLFTSLESRAKSISEKKLLRSYLAMLFWHKDEKEEAVRILETLLNEDDGYRTTHLYSTLGYFLLYTGDTKRAIELNEEAVNYDPIPDIQDNLTASYIAAGDWENAKISCDKVIEKNPAFAEAWYHAGVIAEHSEDYRTADLHYKKALRSIFSTLSLLKKEDVEEKVKTIRLQLENQTQPLLPDNKVTEAEIE